MIAALAILAQATAPAPAPAASEMWEIDQLRYKAPADAAKLTERLQAAHTMAAVIDLFAAEKIAFDRVRIAVDPANFPPEVRMRIVGLPQGEPFVVAQPEFVTVNVLIARRPTGAADSAQALAKVDPQLVAAAESVLLEMRSEEQMRAAVQQNVAQMRSGAAISAQMERNDAVRLQRAKNPQAWDAAATRIGTLQAGVMERVVAELMPELHRQSVLAYAANFTLPELKQMVAFYRSPVGHKMIERGPAVAGATAIWFQRALAERLAPAMAALQPELQQIMAPLTPTPGK